jgi:hypothetical protein
VRQGWNNTKVRSHERTKATGKVKGEPKGPMRCEARAEAKKAFIPINWYTEGCGEREEKS